MGDVDDLQNQEEAAAQREQEARAAERERAADELREEPMRPAGLRVRATRELSLHHVHPGENIRADLPEVQELALSIREVGLLTPLLVRPWDAEGDGKLPDTAEPGADHYRLVAGHRRHAALTALVDAGLDDHATVQCEVREGLGEAELYALMLTENVQRVPLEPIQAARALRLLLDLNEGLTVARLSRSLGLRPGWATTHLKLLELPQEVQDRLEAGDLSLTIADLLRRGQSTGRIDERAAVDLAEKVARGEIDSTTVREAAGPPPKPNTQAPRTVQAGPDGRPIEPVDEADLEPAESAASGPVGGSSTAAATPSRSAGAPVSPPDGETLPRPATPMSDPGRFDGLDAERPVRADGRTGAKMPFVERLDSYLLARALREWADDEYLDELGIDRVMVDAWAESLESGERVAAIRHLAYALWKGEAGTSTAPATERLAPATA